MYRVHVTRDFENEDLSVRLVRNIAAFPIDFETRDGASYIVVNYTNTECPPFTKTNVTGRTIYSRPYNNIYIYRVQKARASTSDVFAKVVYSAPYGFF